MKTLDQVIQETSVDRIDGASAFDAVVIGSGAAGGLAAALLTEGGLKTLVLDAGLTPSPISRPLARSMNATVRMLANPKNLRFIPTRGLWRAREVLKLAGRRRQPIQSRCYAWEGLPNAFVDDLDNPYETPQDRPFNWVRAHYLGGRMVVPAHGKQYLRHGQADFAPTDGRGQAWPIAPGTLDPWYDLVERRLALHGQANGSPWIPDSILSTLLQPDPAQQRLMDTVRAAWPDAAAPMLGRFSEPMRGLEEAARTGLLACRTGAVAARILVGADQQAEGVEYYDKREGRRVTAKAPIVFVCASSLETTRILLNSQSGTFLRHAASDTGALGRYVMDHVSVKMEGTMPDHGIADKAFNLGNCVYLPRFDLRGGVPATPTRGYGVRLYQVPGTAGRSYFTAVSDAEMLPRADNRVTLSSRTDRWGIPILRISVAHSPQERAGAAQQISAVSEIADLLKARINSAKAEASVPGSAIHEVGGARMGATPDTSVVDADNQCWDARGLYVTDGACFPSIGLQNPTLTIMALTARACDHAIRNVR